MQLFASLRALFSRRSAGRKQVTRRLTLEPLEHRLCPSYTVIDLGTLAGTTSSQAFAVNESGQVVGQAYQAIGDMYHAFLWQNGVLTDLGGSSSSAYDINDVGQVVGQAYPGGTGYYHAVL